MSSVVSAEHRLVWVGSVVFQFISYAWDREKEIKVLRCSGSRVSSIGVQDRIEVNICSDFGIALADGLSSRG